MLVEEQWRRTGPAWVRSVQHRPAGGPERGTVVVVPGLGLPSYTLPAARAVAALGLRCVVLDLLAARRRDRVAAHVEPMGQAAAHWVLGLRHRGPVALVGHSTGAQSALVAGLALQASRGGVAVVLAGLTFQPAHRSVPGFLRGAATAYLHDSPRELVVVRDLARVRTDVARLVSSARRDRPEARVEALRVPLVLTAGQHDTFAPRAWLDLVASAAGSPSVEVRTLPGSHNNLFTHPVDFARVVAAAVDRSAGPG